MTDSRFLWGSATAAYQCEGAWREGGKDASNWDAFCHSAENCVNPVTGDVASDHFHRFEEDLDLLREGGQNAYRFSIAWTRVMRGRGEVNEYGIEHYSRVIDACLERDIEPLVTLYHYDLPERLFSRGGWELRETAEEFSEYAATCFTAFGDRVRWWVTINEPSYDTLCSYVAGNYPPNVRDTSRRWRAMYHMLLGSALAVKEFRRSQVEGTIRDGALIGLVSDSYPIETLRENEEYAKAAESADLFFNRCVNDTCILGTVPSELIERLESEGYDLSYMHRDDERVLSRGTVDFLGVNAYERILVKPPVSEHTHYAKDNTGRRDAPKTEKTIGGWFSLDEDPSIPKNDWGMELLPRSIYDLLSELSQRYPNTPFVITENGVGWDEHPDPEGRIHDDYRIEYLSGYVDWIERARREGVDVRGYFVWSTIDLYSWVNGYRKRYGLVYVDYEHDCKRTPKDSWYWYRGLIEGRTREWTD
jgi:6-phospho-beta-glucosidase